MTDSTKMALLDDALQACGGLAAWKRLKRFTLQLSITGELIAPSNPSIRFKDIVAEGCLRRQLVRLTGFASPGVCGVYQPDRVTLEDPEGNILRTWRPSRTAFQLDDEDTFGDELHLIFLCGLCLWRGLTTPFLLSHPDLVTVELPACVEHGQLWRRLAVMFPPTFGTDGYEPTFHFDANGLLRRTDYDLSGVRVADYSWAHEEFMGVVVPTLRRCLALQTDGTMLAKPSLVDVEIFDAEFA